MSIKLLSQRVTPVAPSTKLRTGRTEAVTSDPINFRFVVLRICVGYTCAKQTCAKWGRKKQTCVTWGQIGNPQHLRLLTRQLFGCPQHMIDTGRERTCQRFAAGKMKSHKIIVRATCYYLRCKMYIHFIQIFP